MMADLCATLCLLRATLCNQIDYYTENHRGGTRVLRKVQAENHRVRIEPCKILKSSIRVN